MFPNLSRFSRAQDFAYRLAWPLVFKRCFIKLVPDCSTCSDDCSVHEQLPSAMQKRIDQGDLYDTVKPYKQHLIFAENEHYNKWPPSIDEMQGSTSENISNALKGTKRNIIMTAYSKGNSSEIDNIAYLFPAGLEFKNITRDNSAILTDWLLGSSNPPILESRSISHEAIILVCSHKLRDKRCGVAGPLLIAEFESEINTRSLDMKVLPVSHVGGKSS